MKIRKFLTQTAPLYLAIPFVVISFLLTGFVGFDKIYCPAQIPAKNYFGGNPVLDKEKVYPGYTLLSPTIDLKGINPGGTVYLVDLYGKAVHTWKTQHTVLLPLLKENGNLVTAQVPPGDPKEYPGGGRTGLIQELDWEGNVVWEYKNNLLHHDFEILPNGNIAAITWDEMTEEEAKKVRGGAAKTELKGKMWSDSIVEVDRSGNIIWKWDLKDHLDLSKEDLGPLVPRSELGHSNSLRFTKSNPLTGTEAYLMSVRQLNVVIMIDKNSGEIIWRSAKNMLGHQHDATFLDNGNILVFDNNVLKKPIQGVGSRVVEINPKTNKAVWTFKSGESGSELSMFTASVTSGAQRLPNGNTLITNGPRGQIVEVMQDGNLVWEVINPYFTQRTGSFSNNFLYKARRYSNEIKWPKRLSSPTPQISQFCANIRAN